MPLDHQDRDAPSGGDPHTAEVESGLRALEHHLSRHAAFDRWCADHARRYGRAPGEAPPTDAGEADEPPA